MKRQILTLITGMALGAVLFGGASAVSAGIMAEPSWSPIYVDGEQVSMTAYNIAGNNYVKLRDIGEAVGFNVYYLDGVQVDSQSPYTGEAPAQAQAQVSQSASQGTIKVSSYKGNPIQAGERSMLFISPYGGDYTAVSENPSIVSIERASGQWVAVANASGTATITVTDKSGGIGTLTLTVTPPKAVDLSANMDIRQEMIRLINETRRANGVGELAVNEALMNAAQDCSTKMAGEHDSENECRTAMAYGYPHGFGSNLTRFYGSVESVAQKAVNNWINSPGHFQTMTAERYDTIGVGVTIKNGQACCYMFAGDPDSHHPYE